MKSTLLPLLFAIGLGACVTQEATVQKGPNCEIAAFNLPIADAIAEERAAPIIWIHVDELGLQPVVLDTGASFNTVLAPVEHYAQERASFQKWKNLFSDELGRNIQFYVLPIPEMLVAKAKQRGMGLLVVNPQLIYEDGFTVMDIKHKRLVGFKDEADLRMCYGHGLKMDLRKEEIAVTNTFIDVKLDDKVSGRAFVDTGLFLTEFHSPHLTDNEAKRSEELAKYLVNGDRVVPYISSNHTIQIGNEVKTLERVSVPTSESTMKNDYPIATIGYDALKKSILIFPPKSAGYWEMIF